MRKKKEKKIKIISDRNGFFENFGRTLDIFNIHFGDGMFTTILQLQEQEFKGERKVKLDNLFLE